MLKRDVATKFLVLCVLAVSMLMQPLSAQAHSQELEEGMRAFYAEEYEKAQELFAECLKKHPQDSLAMGYMLHSAYKLKEINTVINQIEQRAVARGEDPTALAHLGMGYFLKGMIIPNQMDESVTEFKQAIKDDPQVSMAYTGLGMVYFQKRMMPRAKGYFVRALRINPHDVMAMELLGNIMLVDDNSSAVSLPEVPLLAVLPGTGGLTLDHGQGGRARSSSALSPTSIAIGTSSGSSPTSVESKSILWR